jgi:NADPH2:quinone reductase
MKAIVIEKHGGPETLQLKEVPLPQPGPEDVRIHQEAIGVNFIDVYHRTGLYPIPVPFTPGSEGAGTIDALGDRVKDFRAGDRVAYAMGPGAYAEYVVLPAAKVVKVPDSVSTHDVAAIMLQGMTVHYLSRSTYPIRPGDAVLIHAAAGGIGLLLTQAAKHLGAFVIGTVSTSEKAKNAKEAGADEIILYTEKDFMQETKRITNGRGVDVVYDSVGEATFEKSLDSLRPRGMMVSFGNSSGPVPPFKPIILSTKGSLFLTRPTLVHYTLTRQELMERAQEVFHWVKSGVFKVRIDSTFPLANAADAHRRLESRASSGKILLLP